MSNLTLALAVGIGGFAGALARFYISDGVSRAISDDFSFVGTLTVNLIGCVAIGFLIVFAERTHWLSPVAQKCLITGLLGSLTTFSTFALDCLNLIQTGRVGAAVVHMTVNVIVGLLLVWLGMLAAGVLVSEPSAPA